MEMSSLLCELVAIPSVNPKVLGGRSDDSEQALSAFIRDTLRQAGLDVELQEVQPGRCNVIAHVDRSPSMDRDVVLLSAHMDTYPSSAPDGGDFRPMVEDGWLHGRGSADAKGSLAAMLVASMAAARSPRRREHYLVASIDEEFGLTGARRLLSHGMRATLAITGEPTQLQPIVAQKGIVRFCLTVAGHAAHAAYPTANNAILKMGAVLRAVEAAAAVLASSSAPDVELAPATLTPTRLIFDGDMNKTPAGGRLYFDARFLPNDSAEHFMQRFESRLRECLDPGIDFTIEPPMFVSPANRCRTDLPLVQTLFAAVDAVSGACVPGSFNYGSEAGVLAEIAQASLVLGPGDPRYSHGPGERVALREVEAATRIFERLLTA